MHPCWEGKIQLLLTRAFEIVMNTNRALVWRRAAIFPAPSRRSLELLAVAGGSRGVL